jgi:acetoin utilization deacetylase AcuC-like enzyme
MGFCLFNNVALGAMYARAVKGMERVFIIDWDLHHGNGIQHIFERDPSIFYFSIHQYPLFPGTGHFTETGTGAGEGYTMNIPLPRGFGDGEFIAIFNKLLRPIIKSYAPDMLLVSAGFDAHRLDPMGKMKVTSAGFAAMTRILMDIAHKYCRSRLILVLEGGYHLDALCESVNAVLFELLNYTITDSIKTMRKIKQRKLSSIIHRCVRVHGHRWKCLLNQL